ncbi:MAG: SDR family oxidoreductase, partial [Balneolaceae bacterium]|nr:SDR family oxidoreductase [Balneolaceae bacterium]
YRMSKAALNIAGVSLAHDLKPQGIAVAIIHPGFVQTDMVGGGETTEVTFNAPEEAGDYEYLCSFPGHFAAGMKGILSVQ